MRLNSNVGKNKISRDFESDAKLSPGAASTPTFLFFVGFSVFPLRTQKHEKQSQKVLQLGRELQRRGLLLSQGDSWYVYSSGPCSPMEAFRTRKGGGGLCCIHAAQNIGNTSFMLNVPNKEAVVRDTQLRDTWTDKNNKRNRFKRKRFDFRGWNYLKERKQSAGCSRAQRSQPWRGPWRQQQVPTPLEGRPPRLWHHTGGIWGMPCSWEKSSSFNGFPGATEVTKRRTKEVPLHIYVPPLFFFAFWPRMS